MRDMLWLRVLAIVSSLVWIAAMAANNWITASFFWNGVFIAINTYNIGVLLLFYSRKSFRLVYR